MNNLNKVIIDNAYPLESKRSKLNNPIHKKITQSINQSINRTKEQWKIGLMTELIKQSMLTTYHVRNRPPNNASKLLPPPKRLRILAKTWHESPPFPISPSDTVFPEFPPFLPLWPSNSSPHTWLPSAWPESIGSAVASVDHIIPVDGGVEPEDLWFHEGAISPRRRAVCRRWWRELSAGYTSHRGGVERRHPARGVECSRLWRHFFHPAVPGRVIRLRGFLWRRGRMWICGETVAVWMFSRWLPRLRWFVPISVEPEHKRKNTKTEWNFFISNKKICIDTKKCMRIQEKVQISDGISINQSTNQANKKSINQSVDQSINQSRAQPTYF